MTVRDSVISEGVDIGNHDVDYRETPIERHDRKRGQDHEIDHTDTSYCTDLAIVPISAIAPISGTFAHEAYSPPCTTVFMETPPELETLANSRVDIAVSNHDYDGEHVIAVDFGPDVRDPSLDVVDGTVTVVVEGRRFEFDLPPTANDVKLNDGVLTITD